MNKILIAIISLPLLASFFFSFGCKKLEKSHETPMPPQEQTAQGNKGEKLFDQHCMMCHPGGRNIINIKNPDDIVKVMRNPKSGMPKFEQEEIPDKDAEAIAEYIFFSILIKR